MARMSPDSTHGQPVDTSVDTIDAPSMKPSSDAAPASTPRGTLLVVEDSRTARAMIRATLGTEWKVAEAESGERALRVARLLRPDAALVDIHLGGMDGIELVQRIREDGDERVRSLPVVFLTGAPDDELRARTGAMGADLLGKPATLPALRAALEQATSRAP